MKSEGYSGAGLFTITILSSCELGMMSNEKARESASELGTAPPFIHTLLYLCESPRTITNFSSIMDTPGTRLITSEASLSCVLLICWADTPLCTTRLRRWSVIIATSVFLFICATTVTSLNVCASASISKLSMSGAWVTFISFCIMSLYPMYLISSVYTPLLRLLNWYLPSMSATVPSVVPESCIVAPVSGSFVARSVTVP